MFCRWKKIPSNASRWQLLELVVHKDFRLKIKSMIKATLTLAIVFFFIIIAQFHFISRNHVVTDL